MHPALSGPRLSISLLRFTLDEAIPEPSCVPALSQVLWVWFYPGGPVASTPGLWGAVGTRPGLLHPLPSSVLFHRFSPQSSGLAAGALPFAAPGTGPRGVAGLVHPADGLPIDRGPVVMGVEGLAKLLLTTVCLVPAPGPA